MLDTEEEFTRKLEEGEIKVNFNGHFAQSSVPIKIADMTNKYSAKHLLDKIIRAIDWFSIEFKEGYGLVPSKAFPERFSYFIYEHCGECGEQIEFMYDGETIYVVHKDSTDLTKPCTAAGGIGSYKCTLDVPSGQIVFANNLRSLVPEANKDRYVNFNSEIKLSSLDYAEHGVSYGFTGNTCPSVIQKGNTIVIGNDNWEDSDRLPIIKGKEIGSICTDLWWYCAMDYDLFHRLAKEKEWSDERIKRTIECVATVEKGTYEVTHYLLQDTWEDGAVFAEFNKVVEK